MSGRIVAFGATGFTGRLVVAELVRRGERPALAGRRAGALEELATASGGLPTATADVADPASVRALVERGDVLVTTVGPFARLGHAALDAAVDAGACYVDSTGEPDFVREVVLEAGPRAERAGSTLLTAAGFDFVPGNLAGALALREAGERARRLDVGYFVAGGASASRGTVASAAGVAGQRAHRRRRGRLDLLPVAGDVATFPWGRGGGGDAVLVGGTEPLHLPALAHGLDEIGAYLGGFGVGGRLVQAAAWSAAGVRRLPGAAHLLDAAARRAAQLAGPDPSPQRRARTTSAVVAVAADATGRRLAVVRLVGGDPYDMTAALMADLAGALAGGEVEGRGAVGPVQALGLDELERRAAAAGLVRA